jgi:hypothetical protein
MNAMSRATEFVAVVVFLLAHLSQPLALDACSLSCEAARAARRAVVAAPCHHSSSCATQITQPTSPGRTVMTAVAVMPSAAAMTTEPHTIIRTPSRSQQPPQHFGSPPIPLRV